MLVYLASFADERQDSAVVAAFNKLAAGTDSMRGHAIVEDPYDADCILFVDSHLCSEAFVASMASHPLVRRYPNKALVYDERDQPWCTLPGVYVSMPRSLFDERRQRAFAYYTASAATAVDTRSEPDLLFSFIGSPGHRSSAGHRVRQELLKIRDERAVIEDSSGFVFYDDRGDPAAHRCRQQRFAAIMARSKFVLCPRGVGTSSIRMYEAMRAGRVPVVLADDWMAPEGPVWTDCTLVIPEQQAHTTADVITANENLWPAMSKAARTAYETWFSPRVMLGRMFDHCESLVNDYAGPPSRWRDRGYRAMRRRVVLQAGRSLAGRTLRAVGLK